MAEDLLSPLSDILWAIVVSGQSSLIAPQKVVNGSVHGVARGFLVLPVIDLQFLLFEGSEQLNRDSLDPLDVRAAQLGLLQKIEDYKRFLVESFASSAGTFFVQFADEAKQFLECLLDGYPVLLAILLGYDVLVVTLEIRAQRILLQHLPEPMLDGLLEFPYSRALGRTAFKLLSEPFEIDLADVASF